MCHCLAPESWAFQHKTPQCTVGPRVGPQPGPHTSSLQRGAHEKRAVSGSASGPRLWLLCGEHVSSVVSVKLGYLVLF